MNWDFIESEEFAEILYMYRTASMSQDVSKYLNHIKKYIKLNMELIEVDRELQAKLVPAETEKGLAPCVICGGTGSIEGMKCCRACGGGGQVFVKPTPETR